MILGSHNSMSYLPLKNWWVAPFNFMARCQKVDYRKQYEQFGVRLFDLRIGFFNGDCPMFCHGLANFKGDVNEVLRYLNEQGDCTIRIILEKGDQDIFKRWVAHWRATFRDINWTTGVAKKGWQDLCGMKSIEKYIRHLYSSMQGTKLDDLCPWLWAKRNNEKIFANLDKNEPVYVMVDFVNIR